MISLAYCDYIADVIRKGLVKDTAEYNTLIKEVAGIEMDLHADGSFKSTTKTIRVEDRSGKSYIVTVSEE